MPEIAPIPAVTYPVTRDDNDVSDRIAPPYDVLDEAGKAALLENDPHNIVAIDLPHLPAKTVGPDETYRQAGDMYRDWLGQGVLTRREKPAVFVYQQTYTVEGRTFRRRGLIANIPALPFGKSEAGRGAVHPHEQTFSGPKEDRLKLMRATQAQLSPIFGLYSDPDEHIAPLLAQVIGAGSASLRGTTTNDDVLHEIWAVDDPARLQPLREALHDKDVFIADGHHRYNTALNYKNELLAQGKDPGKAGYCLFVLVSMQDPGMIVLPTHRVLGNMPSFSMTRLLSAARKDLTISPVAGRGVEGLQALEKALGERNIGPHAMGLYDPTNPDEPLAIAVTRSEDPLAEAFPEKSPAWRQLDVAIVQHLLVEKLCQPTFCERGKEVTWRFPHDLEQLERDADGEAYQLGVILRPTPLDAVRQVSEAGELMPQKSTFFYPKLATGLVVNPLD